MKGLYFITILFVLTGCSTSSKSPIETTDQSYSEMNRPQYHFSPKEKWMNDPNGMVYFDGEYHLFYQHYPDSNVWGPMHWGHAISTDLVNWEHLPIALYPDSLGYIFSGSAVVDWNNTSGFGKNDQPPMVAIFTYHDPIGEKEGSNTFQTQGIAYSTDKGRTWQKYTGNPVIPNPGIRDFRDPKVIWDEQREQWLMVFAANDHIQFYRSDNLKDWQFLSDFGKELGNHEGVWECPDLFPLRLEDSNKDRWILIVSIGSGGPNGGSATQYFIGEFDGKTFSVKEDELTQYQEGRALWIDSGRDNYAGVTWSDIPSKDGRRIFLGWMSNWQYAQVVPTTVWRSAMTLPRELNLNRTPIGDRVFSKPVTELTSLRKNKWSAQQIEVKKESTFLPETDFPLSLSEYILTIELGEVSSGEVVFEFFNSAGEIYQIGIDIDSNSIFSDRSLSGQTDFSTKFINPDFKAPRRSESNTIDFHLFKDLGSIELFADQGEVVSTNLIFPNQPLDRFRIRSTEVSCQIKEITIFELEGIW